MKLSWELRLLGLCSSCMLAVLFLPPSLGCGGGSEASSVADDTAPELASLADSADNSLPDGSTIDINDSIKVTFSEAMDEDTLSSSNIQLADSGGTSAAYNLTEASDTDAINDNEYIITPSSSLKQLTSYTLTVNGGSGGVKDASGNALTSNAVYNFSTACAIEDDFSSDTTISTSSGCWDYIDDASAESSAFLSPYITVANGVLTFSIDTSETTTKHVFLSKNDSGDRTYTLEIVSATEIATATSRIGFEIFKSGMSANVQSLIVTGDPSLRMNITSHNPSDDSDNLVFIEASDFPIILKLVKSGSTASTYYKLEGAGETDFTAMHSNASFNSDDYLVSLYFSKNNTSEAFEAVIDNFTRD